MSTPEGIQTAASDADAKHGVLPADSEKQSSPRQQQSFDIEDVVPDAAVEA